MRRACASCATGAFPAAATCVGTQRVNRAVLPVMRAQESGLLLWVSSTTARGGFPPFLGPYAAAKAAMDSLAITLSYEVARFGIETSIVVPGARRARARSAR